MHEVFNKLPIDCQVPQLVVVLLFGESYVCRLEREESWWQTSHENSEICCTHGTLVEFSVTGRGLLYRKHDYTQYHQAHSEKFGARDDLLEHKVEQYQKVNATQCEQARNNSLVEI